MSKLAIKKYFSFMFLVITFLVMILTFVGLFGGNVTPVGNTARAMLCFALPLLIICNIIILIFWMIRRRWVWAIMPFITLLCCIKYIGTIYQFGSLPKNADSQSGIKIATYNVSSFGREASGFIAQDILTEMKNQKVDILCIQEYSDNSGDIKNTDNYLKYFPYKATGKSDMIIFSKYPITMSKTIIFEQTNNSALWADIKLKGKIVRVFNVHMETTGLNSTMHHMAKSMMRNNDISDNTIIQAIYGNYMFGMMVRAGQAIELSNEKRQSQIPIILCGDFNDVPYSFVYNTLKGDLEDGFTECGSGLMTTFRGGSKSARIDYIFHDKSMKGITYYKRDITYSDHIPVFMKIQL
jgi:endonuclease/exonuclease/phosphatase family metal-dependent hydrolase